MNNFKRRQPTVEEIYNHHSSDLFAALNFVETHTRTMPLPGFIECRDIISHTADYFESKGDDLESTKHIVEIQQHFRRGIIESYQMIFDIEMSVIYRSYEKYKTRLKQYEMLLFLARKHAPIHTKIRDTIHESQELWIKGRSLKNNDLLSPEFKEAIEIFKRAYIHSRGVEDDIDQLWNSFNRRWYPFAIATFGILLMVIMLVL